MITQDELKDIYRALIQPFGHPDPVGYVVRAIMFSGADPAYIGVDGDMGFMPVKMTRVQEMLGKPMDITSLQGNVLTTMTMDMMLFQQYGNIYDMIKVLHFNTNLGYDDIIEVIDNQRMEVLKMLEPRRATVKDVVKLLEDRYKDTKADSTLRKLLNKMVE